MKKSAAEVARDLVVAAAPKGADQVAVQGLAKKIAAAAQIRVEQPDLRPDQQVLSTGPSETITIEADQEDDRFVVRIRLAPPWSVDLQVLAATAHTSVLAIRAVRASRRMRREHFGTMESAVTRKVYLPSAVDAARVVAVFARGQLEVVLPIIGEAAQLGEAQALMVLAEEGPPLWSLGVQLPELLDLGFEEHETREELG